ncbi:S49 family peptidase, partial [bacterium]|nr:S49 family peptidase [bacterium]
AGMKLGNQEITWEQVRHILLWIALPLIIGVLIAAAVPKPVIGLIHLNDAIYSYSAQDMIAQINYAREHPEVRAVVLVMDSPGGTVADTEAVYLELLRLRQAKPIVTSVGSMAASGAYYLSVGSDYIFAKPTSEIGNIGVIGYLPPSPIIFEDIISTGPYKLWGSPRDTYVREMEMIKQGFYQAVRLGRGGRLEVGPETILRGQIWPGSEALRMGLIDALGAESDAVAKAAELARVGHYQAADLYDLAGVQSSSSAFFYQSPEGITMPYPKEPGLYLLYIPPLPVEK